MKKKGKYYLLCLLLAVGVCQSTRAWADDGLTADKKEITEEKGEICLTYCDGTDGQYKLADACFALRRVAVMRSDGSYESLYDVPSLSAECLNEGRTDPSAVLEDIADQPCPVGSETVYAYTDRDGMAVFNNLHRGLYLGYETVPADGYEKSEPFLLSLPCMVDGRWSMHADAEPKPVEKKTSGGKSGIISPSGSSFKSMASAVPKTGDEILPRLMLYLFISSAALMAVLVLAGKIRRERHQKGKR